MTTWKAITAAACSIATLAALTEPAAAHISLTPPQADVGSTFKAVLGVGHGCAGAATTAIRVQIPEGFYNVKPMPKAGWELKTVTGPYATPFNNHGTTLTEGVTEISWSGGDLPDAYYDEFTFRGTFGSTLEAGGKFYFPVIQVCGSTEDAWIDTSGDPEAELPAPALTLTQPEASAHHH
ncbi:MAG: YcnI family copper-binding membrane protein [Devosia sp.]